MNLANIHKASSWFEVLQTTERSQTAVMTLIPGGETGPHPEAHENSEQTMLIVSGRVKGTIGKEDVHLEVGDVVVIPPGELHHFRNDDELPAVTFNVYTPPEYPEDGKG